MHCSVRRNNTQWVNVYFLTLFLSLMTENILATTISPFNIARLGTPRVKLDQSNGVREKIITTRQTHNTTNEVLNNGNISSTPEYENSSSLLNLNNNTTNINHVITTLNTTGSTESDDGPHPSVNLAIIPALAILIFLIIFCIRCCKWLRVYTRGEDKDEVNQYATILQVGDEEYGQVDVTSDSVSTTNNDTVSSYCSFLTRSVNDTPVRAFKGDNLRLITTRESYRKIHRLTDSTQSERRMVYAYTPLQSPGTASIRSDPFKKAFRNQSVSSGEIESPSDSVAFCNENVQIKRLPKSRVSFKECPSDNTLHDKSSRQRTIETSTSDVPSKLEDYVFHRAYSKRVSVRATNQIKFHSANMNGNHSPGKTTPVENKFPCLPSTSDTFISTRNGQNKPTMVCVGVQTDKSFRYSLYKRRRPFSDPGNRENSLCSTLNEEGTNFLLTDNIGKGSKGKGSIKHSRLKNIKRSKNSNSENKENGSIELKNEQLSEENIASSLSLSDVDDDVFVQSEVHRMSEDAKLHDVSCNTKTDDTSSTINDSSSLNYSKSNKNDTDIYLPGQNGINTTCSICQTVHPHPLTSISKCIDHMTNKLSLADCKLCDNVDNDKTSHSTFLPNCDNLYICDQCLTNFSKKKNGIIHSGKELENLTDVMTSHDCDDYIIQRESKLPSKELTSSMTSLESSGYAEISSESSGSP